MAAPCLRSVTSAKRVLCPLLTIARSRHDLARASGGAGLAQRRSIILYRGQGEHLDSPEKACDFISALNPLERSMLRHELQLFHDRLSASTGKGEHVPPTTAQLKLVMFNNALPFVGFGVLDNAIMLIAGEYIDLTIGATLGISVLAAAGLGNMVSDVAGVGLAGYVEILVAKLGMKTPQLRPEQVDNRKTRWSAGLGRALGVSVGCFLGMFPLLFIRNKEKEPETSNSTDDTSA